MTREFGEGERNERREDETDELQELRDRIRARGERSADDPAGRPDDEREVGEGAESRSEAGQERNELGEFGSFVEYLKMRYGPDGGGKAERALAPERERAQGELKVGAYQQEENDDPLEQQSARSEAKREGVSELPERVNDPKEAAEPARVGASPRLGEARVSQAGGEERAKETKTDEGHAEITKSHEGTTSKTDETNSRPERGVAAVGAESRQTYVEKSAAPSSRLDEPEVRIEPKETRGRAEPAEGLGVFSATALRRSDDSTAFEVRLDSLREAGVRFETEKTYEIKGRIGEVCDFRKMYSPGESYRMAILAPKEYAQSITPGEKYNVQIGSVKEIPRNEEHLGVFSATAYRIPGKEDLMRFDLLVSSFERRTGVRFEEGKLYEVRGKIGDVCEFKLTRSAERSQHLFVFAPREYARDLVAGQKYDLTVESVREKMECHITKGTYGFPRLMVQKRALEAAGLKLDGADKGAEVVAELNLKGPEGASHRLFAKVEPKESLVVMSMDKIGAKVGDVFDLQRAGKYSDAGFVEDFNKYRSRELSNVRLQLEGKNLSIFVDGARFEVSEHRLDAYRTQALLRCKVESIQEEIRFWFDGNEATAKFGGSWKIQSFSASEKGMSLTYTREITTRSDMQHLMENTLEMSEIREKVSLLGEAKETEGDHPFQMDDSLYSYVHGRMTKSSENRGVYLQVRGDDGEDVGAAAFSKLKSDEMMRHPFNSEPGRGSHKKGTDSLFRSRDTGELFLVEFRWWQNADAAMKSAFEEVKNRELDEKFDETWGVISGAYIAIVDFDMTSRRGVLRVKRVW